MEINHLIVLLIGISGSSVIHFSQGLMRLGIMRKTAAGITNRTRWIYGTGVVLNLSAPLWVVLANRFGHHTDIIPQGLLFGILGGCFLALDSLLKGVAQYDSGNAAFLPSTGSGLALFVLSFIGAAAAFGMTQWAHIRNARASETIAGYDAAYVALPVLILPLSASDSAGVSTLCYSGLASLGIGLLFMVSGQHKFNWIKDPEGERRMPMKSGKN